VARLTATAVVLAVLTAASAAYAAPAPPRHYSRGVASPELRSLVRAVGGSANDAVSGRYAYLRKLDGHVQALSTARLASRAPTQQERAGLTLSRSGEVLVDVYVNGDMSAARRALEMTGMRVEAVSDREPERIVEGWLGPREAVDTAALSSTKAVLAVMGGGTDVGSVTSQGDAAHNGPAARALGFNGAGVTVGVISDSMNQQGGGIAGSVGTGDLPTDTVSLADAVGASDEGRAMSEIIYDEAPGIPKLRFSTGGTGAAAKATSINNLVAAGAKVIADDTFYLTEPMFQDGVVAQAVDAAKAAGVAYFSSAGNRARQSWEGTFTPGTGGYNNFNPGGAEDIEQTVVSVPGGGGNLGVTLQWAEPFGGATTNLALEAYNITGGDVLIPTSDTDNIATGIPLEQFSISNNGGSPATVGIRIRRVAGTGTPKLKYIARNNFNTFNVVEHNTSSPTINPDAASANGAFTVAAVDFSDAGLNTAEVFSSRGPATRLFDSGGNPLASPDVRAKPDAAAADGVATDFPSGPLNPFFGTSAATPSAAGIAVLLRQANPGMSVNELYAILRNPANDIDCTSAAGVPDFDCGAGFILADKAVTQALDNTPPSVIPNITSTGTSANGFFHGDVNVTWGLTDLQSPVGDSTGCGPTTINTDGSFPLTCTASSAGGPTTQTVTIKRDASPPTNISFQGIAAKSYSLANLPKKSKVKCTATDPTSGLTSCAVSGYSSKPGKHKLTATATNGAGLTATKTLSYTVLGSVSGLKVQKTISLHQLLGAGLPVQFTVGAPGTKVSITITATSVTSATAAKSTVVGKFRKVVKKKGKFKARVRLTGKGRSTLGGAKKATLRVTVSGSSKRIGNASVSRKVTAKK
jgi:Subtilase family